MDRAGRIPVGNEYIVGSNGSDAPGCQRGNSWQVLQLLCAGVLLPSLCVELKRLQVCCFCAAAFKAAELSSAGGRGGAAVASSIAA